MAFTFWWRRRESPLQGAVALASATRLVGERDEAVHFARPTRPHVCTGRSFDFQPKIEQNEKARDKLELFHLGGGGGNRPSWPATSLASEVAFAGSWRCHSNSPLTPRPQALYRRFYILSLITLFNLTHANRRALVRRVTYFLALAQSNPA